MNVLVTGSNGFIGKNLMERLTADSSIQVLAHDRSNSKSDLQKNLDQSDAVFHLAGVNRSNSDLDFENVNVGLTRLIVEHLTISNHLIPIVFTSSTQAGNDTIYGTTKSAAERLLIDYVTEFEGKTRIYRLPNVFGKWSRPDYNSVVATFCFRVARDLGVHMPNPSSQLRLICVTDVIDKLLQELKFASSSQLFGDVEPVFETTVGEVYSIIKGFRNQNIEFEFRKEISQLVGDLKDTYSYFSKQVEN
jgi:UDP-2-acetamido-2,6-beta-L-arabino-hexul-4-ose reductase